MCRAYFEFREKDLFFLFFCNRNPFPTEMSSLSERVEKVQGSMSLAEKAVNLLLSDIQEAVEKEKEELALARRLNTYSCNNFQKL